MAESLANKQVIEVDDYYDQVHQASWTRRTAGTMAGATLGVIYGAIIGTIAAFIPGALTALGVAGATAAVAGATATVLPTLGMIATSAAILAGIGGLTGIASVSMAGMSAGAVATGFEEHEKREKLRQLKDSGLLDSSASPEVNIKETELALPPPYKWRTALFTVPLFAGFGALLGFTPVMAPLLASAPFSLVAGSNAAAAASAGILGMWGALLPRTQSYYTNKLTNVYTKILKDKFFANKEEGGQALAIAQPEKQAEATIAPELSVIGEPAPNTKRFSSEKMRFSMQGLIEKTEEHSVEHNVVITR